MNKHTNAPTPHTDAQRALPIIPSVSKRTTRKATREARATTLARKAQRAMKYGGK